MLPCAVIPLNDPKGLLLPHLQRVMPELPQLFDKVFVSLTLPTQQEQPDFCSWIRGEPFFDMLEHQEPLSVGQDFCRLYRHVAESAHAEQPLHLCFIDRVAFALQSEHAAQFCADIEQTTLADTPLVFHRSEAAWRTHPSNYYTFEQMVVQAGELLFGQTLDFAWCHMAVSAAQLRAVLPQVKSANIDMVAELVLHLRHQIKTKEVDWLAWEDPFVFGRNALELKREREASLGEHQKRLNYVIPMLQHLAAAARIE